MAHQPKGQEQLTPPHRPAAPTGEEKREQGLVGGGGGYRKSESRVSFFNIPPAGGRGAANTQQFMTKETREWVQYGSAVGMLACGVVLSVWGFATPPRGEISDSVLWFFAQCLIYAGSIFGVSIYINDKITGKFADLQEKIRQAMADGHSSNNSKKKGNNGKGDRETDSGHKEV